MIVCMLRLFNRPRRQHRHTQQPQIDAKQPQEGTNCPNEDVKNQQKGTKRSHKVAYHPKTRKTATKRFINGHWGQIWTW